MSLWLIGAGPHAQEYAKVLIDLGVPFEVVGRGAGSAQAFETKQMGEAGAAAATILISHTHSRRRRRRRPS